MNLKKIFAAIAATAVAVSAMTVSAFAMTSDKVEAVKLDSASEDGKLVQWPITVLTDFATVSKVTLKGTAVPGDGWCGGGGQVGLESTDGWKQFDFALDGENVTLDSATGDFTAEFDFGGVTPALATEGGIVQVGWWWGSGDGTMQIVDLTVDGTSIIGLEAQAAPVAEEEATEEETVEEEATEEEVVEEEVVEEEAAEGFALEECYNNGTVILVADDGQNAYATSNGVDITSVYGYRAVLQFPLAETTDEAAWIGGGIGTNSNSTGWAQNEWGKASGEKPIVAEFDENGVTTIELLGDAPLFAADDAYAQLWLQCWGGTMNIISVEVLGEGGSVIASATVGELAAAEAPEAEEEVEEAPAAGDVDASTDSSKGSPDTGVADVAAVAGIAVVAAGAFIVAKKRK